MKEFRDPNPRPPVRRVGQEGLLVELYRVISFFHGSKGISSPADEVGNIPAMQLIAEEVQESEIVSALVSASIKIRLLDEQLWNGPDEVKDLLQFTTGQLWNPRDASSPVDLSIREACNKIVHATDIGFFVDESKYRPESFLTPRFLEPKLAVYGTLRGTEWRAEVLIDQFAEAGYWLGRYA